MSSPSEAQAALDLLPIGAALYRDGRFVWANRALSEMLGYAHAQLVSLDPYDLLSPEDALRVRTRFDARQRGEAPTSVYEIRVRRADGSWAAIEMETRVVGPGESIVLYRDLSPHQRAQKLLSELAGLAARVQQARSPLAVERAALEGLFALGFSAAVVVIDGDSFVCEWKMPPEIEALLQPLFATRMPRGKFEPADACLRSLETVYVDDVIEALGPVLAEYQVTVSSEQIARLRKLGIDKVVASPLSVQGQPYGALLVCGEGMSRQTGAALSLFAAQLASALEVSETIVELQQKNRRLAAINALADAGNEGEPAELAVKLLRIVIEATASDAASIFRAKGDVLELEKALNVPDWFAERYRRLPLAGTITGGTAASRNGRALTVDDWPPEHREHLLRAGSYASAVLPLEVKGRLGGALVLSRARKAPYRGEDLSTAEVLAGQVAVQLERGNLVVALRQSYDDLARAQQELVKNERLAALGELAAVIAHEVRNPLGVVFNSLASLRRTPMSDDARALLAIVLEESERLDRLVSDLLDFVRPNEPRLERESAALLVASAVEAARRGTGLQGVQVRVDLPARLPTVLVDVQLCRQALLNLLLNAAQAMGRGGDVVVRARLDETRPQPAVRIDVVDTGAGIAPEVADKIFQPFFTTRASGTGLGLALVKRIAEAHRTELKFESAPGKGTTFSMWLPLAPAQA